MKNQITIREAVIEADIAAFWNQLHTYHKRDIFPDPEDEGLKHFLSDAEYRAQIESFTTDRRTIAITCFFIGPGKTSASHCR